MLGGRESGGGRFSNPPNKLRPSPLNYISYGGPSTAGTTQWEGGIQRLQRAPGLFLLLIRESNHVWWFMSHRNILWWTNPRRQHHSRILVVLFPLRRHPLPLTSSTWRASRTWFGHPVMGVRGGCWLRRWWVISSAWGWGSLVSTFWGPAQTRGQDELKHTCGCPRCVVHYETCMQSLMPQVRDLRAQNLELQRSQQEFSRAVASTAGISHSYGDRMTQILSTLAKFEAVVQG